MTKSIKNFRMMAVAIMVCMGFVLASCENDDESAATYDSYSCYRKAQVGPFSSFKKDGEIYRPVQFEALQVGSSEKEAHVRLYTFTVYNDDAVNYYDYEGMTSLPGYPGWYFNSKAVTSTTVEVTSDYQFKYSDGTVLKWSVEENEDNPDHYTIKALTDEKGNVVYVGWNYDEKF